MSDTPIIASHLYQTLSKGERTRIRILDRSTTCFVRRGFDGASFSELAAFCGVNRGLFVHYFSTKHLLIQEVLEFVVTGLRAHTDHFMSTQSEAWPEPTQRYVEATFSWAREFPDHANYLLVCLQRTSSDEATAKKVRTTFRKAWERIELMPAGKKKNLGPGAAREIHTAVVGAVLMAITMGPSEFEPFRERCHAMVSKLSVG